MKKYGFDVTYCYFGETNVKKVIVEARSLVSAWNKILKVIPVTPSLLDIKFVSIILGGFYEV